MPGRGFARGFTLIETLVALMIAAVAAAVILSHVRTLMLRAEKEQSHQLAVMQLLNDSLRAACSTLPAEVTTRLEEEKNQLALVVKDAALGDLPPIQVRNFSAGGNEKLPPIAFAYTPFQVFGVTRDRYALYAIGPSLKPPESSQGSAVLPATTPAATTTPVPGETANTAASSPPPASANTASSPADAPPSPPSPPSPSSPPRSQPVPSSAPGEAPPTSAPGNASPAPAATDTPKVN